MSSSSDLGWEPIIAPQTRSPEIRSPLVELTLRLNHLDDEITHLQEAIDKLAQERDSLGAYVAAHKAPVSPVRRLPLDII